MNTLPNNTTYSYRVDNGTHLKWTYYGQIEKQNFAVSSALAFCDKPASKVAFLFITPWILEFLSSICTIRSNLFQSQIKSLEASVSIHVASASLEAIYNTP